MKSKIKQLLLTITMLLPLTTYAHPGHGASDGTSWLHYLGSAIHLGVGLMLFLLLLASVAYYKRQSKESR